MAEAMFNVASEQGVQVLTLSMPFTLDASEFDDLNVGLKQALLGKAHQPWVLDLTSVDYMGSAVLGLMVNVRQQIKTAGGKLALCGMSHKLANVFHACSLERLFTIVRTRDEALAAVGRK